MCARWGGDCVQGEVGECMQSEVEESDPLTMKLIQ